MYFQKRMERVFIFHCQNLWTWLVYQFDLWRKMKCWLFLDCLGLHWAFMSYVFKISWCIMWPLTFHVTEFTILSGQGKFFEKQLLFLLRSFNPYLILKSLTSFKAFNNRLFWYICTSRFTYWLYWYPNVYIFFSCAAVFVSDFNFYFLKY